MTAHHIYFDLLKENPFSGAGTDGMQSLQETKSNESAQDFSHWLVEGDFDSGLPDVGGEWGWLFARAIEAEKR